ncbi:SPFH domain-containing protein [Gilliamella sp. Imp1-1]|uniref:SPFH domain-containing protein n=1 Tax=Gilliamella sp. Imp1-1 TaxID=3120248 RepID=UPI0005500BEA|nr:prohibitin family protein [Gilliamella apicola]OCG56813.1 Band 7 protein [Gilliamella apicola]
MKEKRTTEMSILKIVFIAIAIVIGLYISIAGWYTVDAGERAVQLRNGAITRTNDAGLYFKLPFIDSVKYISTRTQNRSFNELSTYSKDQQPAKIRASVTYKVPSGEAENVYLNFRDIEGLASNTIERQVPNQIENVFGHYSAIEAVQKRAQLTKDVNDAIKQSLENYPIIVESVQIEDIDFSRAYEQSVEDRMKAEVEVQTQKQNLEKEKITAEIAVTKAQAIADSTLAQAKAEAEAVILRGEAEAKAITAKTKALQANSALVELTKAEKWDGKLPATVLPNSTLPFIDTK